MRRLPFNMVSYLVAASCLLSISNLAVQAENQNLSLQDAQNWQLIERRGQDSENKFDNLKAKKYYQQALALGAKIGPDSNQRLESLAHVCNACVLEKQMSEAETYYLALVSAVQEKKKKNAKLKYQSLSDGLMSAMDDLADSYFNTPTQTPEKKAEVMKHALRLRDLISGDVHPEMSKNLWALTLHYYLLKKYFDAEPYADRLVAIDSKKLQADDMKLGTEFQTLGTIKGNNLKLGDAEFYLRQAIAVFSSSNNMKLEQANIVRTELATVLIRKKDLVKAEKTASESLAFFEFKYGKNSAQAVGTRNILASIQMKRKNWKAAEQNLLLSIKALEANYGINQEIELSPLNQLLKCYTESGNTRQAKVIGDRIANIERLMKKVKTRN